MNRRIFIKSVGISATLAVTPLVFAENKYEIIRQKTKKAICQWEQEQQWIKYTVQRPKVGCYIVVLYVYEEVREICCGRVSRSERGNLFVDFTEENRISNKAASDLGFTSDHAEDCMGVGFTYVDDSVYWIPIKNKLPNKLPKFNK